MIGLKQLLTKISAIVNMYGEVGAIYITTASTNPATFFGGQWEKIEGRFLIGAGGSVGVNVMGGTMNATISAAHLPGHTHQAICSGDAQSARSGSTHTFLWKNNSGGSICNTTTTGNGSSTTHNNIPPYYVVHIWRRRDSTATLTYDINGGVRGSVPTSQTISDNADCYLTSAIPTKNAYVFLGWSTNPDAIYPEYQPGALFKLKGVSAQTTTLYAVWVSQTLNINLLSVNQRGESRTISAEGGIIEGPSTVQYGNSITVKATPKKGYVFRGWTTSINSLAYISIEPEYTFTPDNHTTLYGIFEKQTVRFYIDGLVYQFDNGMTWEEWVMSPFNNTNDIEIEKGYVISQNSKNAGYSKYIYSTTLGSAPMYPSDDLYPSLAMTPGGKVSAASLIAVNGAYYTGHYLEQEPETLNTYTLSLQTVNATIATVSGSGQYEAGALVVAEALDLGIIVGYETILQEEVIGGEPRHFLGWFTNSAGTGTPVSRKPVYQFNITGNTNLYAVFEIANINFTVNGVEFTIPDTIQTWNDLINSSYNTNSKFTINNNQVYYNGAVMLLNNQSIVPEQYIINHSVYDLDQFYIICDNNTYYYNVLDTWNDFITTHSEFKITKNYIYYNNKPIIETNNNLVSASGSPTHQAVYTSVNASFTYCNSTYYYRNGMTWQEYISSSYNGLGSYRMSNVGGYVCDSDGDYLAYSGSQISTSTAIVNGRSYSYISSGCSSDTDDDG